jgi:hypothetical protein
MAAHGYNHSYFYRRIKVQVQAEQCQHEILSEKKLNFQQQQQKPWGSDSSGTACAWQVQDLEFNP